MQFRAILFIVLLSFSVLPAGDKMLTMEEAILGTRNNLKVENMSRLQWIAGEAAFSYVDSLNGVYGLLRGEPENNDRQILLSLDSLNQALQSVGAGPLKRFPSITWLDGYRFRFTAGAHLLHYDLQNQTAQKLNRIPEDAKAKAIHEKSARVAFTKENNVYIAYAPERVVQVTHDTEDGIVNGSGYVHRSEFGISKGMFWSPEAKYLAFYRKDERMVARYPLVDIDERPAQLRWTRYPMAGMTSEQVQIGIYNAESASITYLQTGEPRDHYLTSMSWGPEGRFIYVGELNRDQNHFRMIKYDPHSGQALHVLFEEKDEQWVEPMHGLFFVPGRNDRFLWLSKREGFNQLYFYDTSGKLRRKIFDKNQDITRFIGFDNDGKTAFFEAASSDGLERHGYRASLKSGKVKKMTKTSGVHRIEPSDDGAYFIDRFTSPDTPRQISIIDKDGDMVQQLLDAPNPLTEYKLGRVKLLKIKSDADDMLNARMILPPDFDETKKYPAIVYVYGGPHGQMITNRWMGSWHLWFQYMAQRGYVIFSLDNRGTNNRGIEFEQALFRQLGKVEAADQISGVNYLKKQSFIDTARIGVHGWSYGGFMTLYLLTKYPEVFKAGVAGGPVVNWEYYEVMYGERYMDTPQANSGGYAQSNILNYVDQLNAKLLVIHGGVDPVVVPQNSLSFLRKAIDKQKQVDFFIYPGDEHNMRGQDRVHLYQKITDFFELHL